MTREGWESGTILLPAKEAVPFRRDIAKLVNTFRTDLYETSQAFWKTLTPKERRNFKFYEVALRARFNPPQRYAGFSYQSPTKPSVDRFLWGLLFELNDNTWDTAQTPRRLLWPDIDHAIGKPTGSKFSVSIGGEAVFTCDGRKVHWGVGANNHSVEAAWDHPLTSFLFKRLEKVAWTRGTGGKITGNDEYNEEAREEGGGANYLVRGYGPLGTPASQNHYR